MSEVLDRPVSRPDAAGGATPPGGSGTHPIVGFVAGLRAGLDAVAGSVAWSMTPAEQRAVLVELAAARARVEELDLRVLVSAERTGVGEEAGATSTPAGWADATGRTRASCFAARHLGLALDGGFAATGAASAAGEIDAERARVIVHAVEALTSEYDDLPEGTPAAAEAHLLDLARRFDVVTVRRLGKRLFEVVCPEAADRVEGDGLAREEARARRLACVSVRDNGDGTSEVRFRLPAVHAELLVKALSELTSPTRLGVARIDPVTGRARPPGWPVPPGSSPPCSVGTRCRWTWAANGGCSPGCRPAQGPPPPRDGALPYPGAATRTGSSGRFAPGTARPARTACRCGREVATTPCRRPAPVPADRAGPRPRRLRGDGP